MYTKFKNLYSNKIKHVRNYIYIKPHKLLSKYIAHYTIYYLDRYNNTPEKLNLIPDLSGCFVFKVNNNNISNSVFGASTKLTNVDNKFEKCIFMFFIEFYPCGLYYFTDINLSDTSDKVLPLNELNKNIDLNIKQIFEKENDLDEIVQKIDFLLLNSIHKKEISPIIQSSIYYMKKNKFKISVKELSDLQFYSQRHINRIFYEYININIKTFIKINKINSAVKIMKNMDKNKTLSNIANDMDYYDQSHFIHEFKNVCGVTPKKFILNMSDFYNEPFKI